jgi:Flp pilus assembly protein TadD
VTRKRLPLYVAAFVSLATFLVYLPVLWNNFVLWDDDTYVIANVHIHSLNPAFFKWAFSSFYANNWHPLTWVSLALDYAVWGLNPLGYHLTNNIIHAVNTFLVVLLFIKILTILKERATRDETRAFLNQRSITIAAGTTGLLFGLHPLHVESVAWIAERKDLLCGLFFLLSLSVYSEYIRGTVNGPAERKGAASAFSNKFYLASFIFFVLALLSKPMAVSLPVVLLMLDWYPFRRIRSLTSCVHSCVEKLPFLACSLLSSILTIMAQKGAMTMMTFVPLRERILVAAKAIQAYLTGMAAPVGLNAYYPYPSQQDITLLSPHYLFAVIFVIGITVIFLVAAKKQMLWLSAWGYYVVTLIPVIGIVQVGGQSMADRYTYLPSLGPFFIVGIIAAWAWAKTDSLKRRRVTVKGLTIFMSISIVISLSYITVRQIAVWRDSLTLFTDMVRKSPGAAMPHDNLGATYLDQNRVDKAINEFTAALKIMPDYANAHYNLGTAYAKQNRLREAVTEFKAALRISPDYAEAHNNLGVAYADQNRLLEAVAEFNAALRIKPDYAEAHNNLGIAYGVQNRLREAVAEFNAALRIKPDYAEARYNLGITYERMGAMKP